MDASVETSTESQTSYGSVSGGPETNMKNLLSFKVYKRRWFVLLVLCLLNCSNATLWLTFAPVADQSAQYLKVTLGEVNWLSLVFMVVAIPLSFGTTWMLDSLGLRITLILGSWLNMLGAVLRFLGRLATDSYDARYAVVMCGQTLGALAQPLIIFAPTKLTAQWFPDHQRATANMIASMSNPLGVLIANLASPLIASSSTQIPDLLLVYALPTCVICFLATVGIRSSKPPTPPSASAESSGSEPFVHGIKLVAAEEQSLPGPAAVLRLRHRRLHLLLHAAGAGPVRAGIRRRLRRPVRRPLHRVRRHRRRRSGSLRRQDEEVHRGHKDQHELQRAGVHRLLRGVSPASAESGRCCRLFSLRLFRIRHLPGCHGAVRGVLVSGRRGHVGRTRLHIGTGAVRPLHRPPPGFDHAARRLSAVHVWGRGLELESAPGGDGGTLQLLHLLLRHLLPHRLQTSGGRGAGEEPRGALRRAHADPADVK